jgi:hypothetical protein
MDERIIAEEKYGVHIFFSLLGLVLPAAAAPAPRRSVQLAAADVTSSHQTPSAFDHVRILCKLKVKLWYTQANYY